MTNIGAITLLKGNPLFRGLSEQTLERIAGLGHNRHYAAKTVIFRQGEPGSALYGVISGEVEISTQSADGRVLRLNTQLPGEITGEIALLDGGVRTATATMAVPGMLFVLERRPLLELLEAEPRLAIKFIELACERIRWTSRLLEESAFMSVPERLASRLVWISRTSGVPMDGGTQVRISQSALAEWLNVSRQVVNGYLQDWQAEGLLKVSRGTVLILDPDGLAAVH